APARADVEHALSRLDGELGGKVALLGELRLLEVGAFGEVAAGILPVGIEEQVVDGAVDVVVVRNVASRPSGRIELHQPSEQIAAGVEALGPARQRPVLQVGNDQLKKVVNAAFDHL